MNGEQSDAGARPPAPTRLPAPDKAGTGPAAPDLATEHTPPASGPSTVTRRTALKVLASAAALGGSASACSADPDPGAHEALSGFAPLPARNPLAAGTPADPDLLAPEVPWDLVLADDEMRFVSVLADLIIPADERSPSASAVGVPAYINEFVSAPAHKEQLALVRGGLAWLNRAARERFGAADFPALAPDQQRAICNDICFEPQARADLKPLARFFDLFRDMTSTGFWTTDEGMRDLGFVGNVPLPSFDGPPPEVLARLGLEGEDLL